jgi:hypothetical protein
MKNAARVMALLLAVTGYGIGWPDTWAQPVSATYGPEIPTFTPVATTKPVEKRLSVPGTGRATWYGARCPAGVSNFNRVDTCTPYKSKAAGGRGGELVMYGAVHGFRVYGDKPFPVLVCLRDEPSRCVRVIVRDWCGCQGHKSRPDDNPIIDLAPTAFRQLAPLGRGVIYVVVKLENPAGERRGHGGR